MTIFIYLNNYFIKISAHLHCVRKLLCFRILYKCRYCADVRRVKAMLRQQEFIFFFMIDMIYSLSVMILLVSLQSTNGIFMIWHYEGHRFRGGECDLETDGVCTDLHSICTRVIALIYSELQCLCRCADILLEQQNSVNDDVLTSSSSFASPILFLCGKEGEGNG